MTERVGEGYSPRSARKSKTFYLRLLVEFRHHMLARRMPVGKDHERSGELRVAERVWFRTRPSLSAESNMRQLAGRLWLQNRNVHLQKAKNYFSHFNFKPTSFRKKLRARNWFDTIIWRLKHFPESFRFVLEPARFRCEALTPLKLPPPRPSIHELLCLQSCIITSFGCSKHLHNWNQFWADYSINTFRFFGWTSDVKRQTICLFKFLTWAN